MEPAASSSVPALLATSLTGLVIATIAAYVALLGPGQAWWQGRASSTPRLLARVAVSALFTTLVGLGLAAVGAFSLPRVAAIGGLATLLGYVFVGRVRDDEPGARVGAGLGPLVFVLALWAYWPAYETHMAASDSTAYTAAGVHLARAHHLWKLDPVADDLPPLLRTRLFFSVMGNPWKPPYARMPGGLIIDNPLSNVVMPSFFPAPVVWSALSADALGARYAGAFAPLFGALAVWAFWHFARRRFSAVPALFATTLVGINAACYWAGRFPLAEPLAWAFLWVGLVALDAFEEDGFAADARLAGAMFGAVGLVRLEYLGFLTGAVALRYVLRVTIASRPLTPGFALWFVAIGGAALAQVALLPGSYVTPIADALDGIHYRVAVALATMPWAAAIAAVAAAMAALLTIRALGFARFVALSVVLTVVGAYVVTSHSTAGRSIEWLTAHLGPFTLLLAMAGAVVMWRERHAVTGNGFFLATAVLISSLLIYAPHVYPAMPWASRRFVPLVVPALITLATIAIAKLRTRSLAAAVIAGALVAATIAWPARAMWRLPFYEGTYAELTRLAEELPRDGTLLIDNRLITLLISTPLWLAFDRNSVPVDLSTFEGRKSAAWAAHALGKRGPVYVLKPSRVPQETVFLVTTRRIKDFEIEIALPEQSAASPPAKLEDYVELVSLFELKPIPLSH